MSNEFAYGAAFKGLLHGNISQQNSEIITEKFILLFLSFSC